jgi:hypothetical protein
LHSANREVFENPSRCLRRRLGSGIDDDLGSDALDSSAEGCMRAWAIGQVVTTCCEEEVLMASGIPILQDPLL